MADLALDFVLRKKALWDLGMPGMRLDLLTWGSVRRRTVSAVRSFMILAVAVTFFLRFAWINLVAKIDWVMMIERE